MPNVFISSDHHMDHRNILTFTKSDGSLLRPNFKDEKEMNQYIIEQHNSVVRSVDKVYFLGDFAMRDKAIPLAKHMNGHKRLILGNHDYGNMRLYLPYFESVYGSRMLDRMLFTHFPVHPLSIGKAKANVHGHVHGNVDAGHFGSQYLNVSLEALEGYKPLSIEQVKKKVQKQLEDSGSPEEW